jgi:FixJ family two-component response regulator
VVEAVRRLRAGEALMPIEEAVAMRSIAGSEREQAYEARQAIEKLTPREIEVLQALAVGLDSGGIAEKSLRFNHEGFCDELYVHRKTPRLLSSRTQAALLTAG